jgi:hypothetical protein
MDSKASLHVRLGFHGCSPFVLEYCKVRTKRTARPQMQGFAKKVIENKKPDVLAMECRHA